MIQLGLCIERQPIRYFDPLYESKFRIFRENWSIRTCNSLSLLQTKNTDRSFQINSLTDDSKVTDSFSLDNLLEQERSFIQEISAKTDTTDAVDKSNENYTDNSDQNNLKNINRLSEDRLYLIIKRNNTCNWSFPIINYNPEFTLRETLLNLCDQNLFHDFSIYFLGYSPICHIKTRDSQQNKVSKIFYYRARVIPGKNIQINSEISDYAWVNRAELKRHLDILKYKRIFQSLPLW